MKRVAGQEVNNRSLIQNAWDLYKVMQQLPSKVNYIYIMTKTIKEEAAKIQEMTMKTVKGTMKIQAVVGLGDGRYAIMLQGLLLQGRGVCSGVSWVGDEGRVI